MAINNFKPFATEAGANVISQADYEVLTSLLSGFQSGKASSAQVNKVLRQATFISSVLAQFIADTAGVNVLDNGDATALLTSLIAALKANGAKDFLQKSNNLAEIAAAGPAAVNAALTNLGLGEAARRGVGTAANQIPDISAFDFSRSQNKEWDILPSGMIRQSGTVGLTPVGNFNPQTLGGVTYYTHYYRINFPRQYPSAQIATLATLASSSFSAQISMAGKSLSTHRDTDGGSDVSKTRFTVAYTTPNLGETPTLHFESVGY